MNSYGEQYLCFYKKNQDFFIGNKNYNVAKVIENFTKKNSSIICNWFKLDNQDAKKWIEICNQALFLNKNTYKTPNGVTKVNNFCYRFLNNKNYLTTKENVEWFLRRQNCDSSIDWQDFFIIEKSSIAKMIDNFIGHFNFDLKKNNIINITDMKEKVDLPNFSDLQSYKASIFNLFKNHKEISLLSRINEKSLESAGEEFQLFLKKKQNNHKKHLTF